MDVAATNGRFPVWGAMAYHSGMHGRRRPRLKRFLIRCDNCRREAMRLYPSREAVRRKGSPFTFCSTRCSRMSWEARRRQERAAAVEPYPCALAECEEQIIPTVAPGRPRTYCSHRCKAAAAHQREERQPGGTVLRAREALREAQDSATYARWQATEYRVSLDKQKADLAEAQRQIAANKEERRRYAGYLHSFEDKPTSLKDGVLERMERWKLQQLDLDAAAEAAEARMTTAAEVLRRSEARLAHRAASARQRRAKAKGSPVPTDVPTSAAPTTVLL